MKSKYIIDFFRKFEKIKIKIIFIILYQFIP